MKDVLVRAARAHVLRVVRAQEDFPERGACLLYALAALGVGKVLGVRLVLQAGTATWPFVAPELDDGVSANSFGYEWDPEHLRSSHALALGLMPEMHVWAGDPVAQEVVDLSTEHWPAQRAMLMGGDSGWTGPRPPVWLWGKPPARVVYLPNAEATAHATRLAKMFLKENQGTF